MAPGPLTGGSRRKGRASFTSATGGHTVPTSPEQEAIVAFDFCGAQSWSQRVVTPGEVLEDYPWCAHPRDPDSRRVPVSRRTHLCREARSLSAGQDDTVTHDRLDPADIPPVSALVRRRARRADGMTGSPGGLDRNPQPTDHGL